MDTVERIRCKCGLPMEPLRKGVMYCKNCDVPHALVTKYDIHFNMWWKRYMENEMPPAEGTNLSDDAPDDEKE